MDVFVAGGTGFIGRSLCVALADRGHAVTAGARSPENTPLSAQVETVAMDVTEPDLAHVVEGHDAVVNLVALPSHRQIRGRSHGAVHRDGTRHLVQASEATGVTRFVQLSGLGVDTDVQTAYFAAKRRAEQIVRDSSVDSVLYRPSVVFGDGCAFLPFLERLTAARIVPLPGGGTMTIQPIWVEDLASMLADGLEDDRHVGACYELGGPEVLTLAETISLVRPGTSIISMPTPLARIAFVLADFVPMVPVGRDQFRALQLANTVEENDVTEFGVATSDLRSLQAYLGRSSS